MWNQLYGSGASISLGNTNIIPKIFKLPNSQTTGDYLSETIMKTLEPSIIDSFFIDNLSVEIEKESNYYICSDPFTTMYGTGKSISEAIDSYKYVLIDFYKFLKSKNLQQLDESYRSALEYLEKAIINI